MEKDEQAFRWREAGDNAKEKAAKKQKEEFLASSKKWAEDSDKILEEIMKKYKKFEVRTREHARAAPVAAEQQRTPRRGAGQVPRAARRASRRSSSAERASRTWKRIVCPTRTRSPTKSAPLSRSPPWIGADEEVAARVVGRVLVITRPASRPSRARRRSSGASSSITCCSFSIAGRPASSWTVEPSASVITISGPIGMQPCETTV